LGKEEEELNGIVMLSNYRGIHHHKPEVSEPSLTKELQGEARSKEVKGCISSTFEVCMS
jgi:hypothetical protein